MMSTLGQLPGDAFTLPLVQDKQLLKLCCRQVSVLFSVSIMLNSGCLLITCMIKEYPALGKPCERYLSALSCFVLRDRQPAHCMFLFNPRGLCRLPLLSYA